MRKPVGDGEVIIRLAQVQEQIRAQDCLITSNHRLGKRLVTIQPRENQLLELSNCLIWDWTTRCKLEKTAHQTAGFLPGLGGCRQYSEIVKKNPVTCWGPGC